MKFPFYNHSFARSIKTGILRLNDLTLGGGWISLNGQQVSFQFLSLSSIFILWSKSWKGYLSNRFDFNMQCYKSWNLALLKWQNFTFFGLKTSFKSTEKLFSIEVKSNFRFVMSKSNFLMTFELSMNKFFMAKYIKYKVVVKGISIL